MWTANRMTMAEMIDCAENAVGFIRDARKQPGNSTLSFTFNDIHTGRVFHALQYQRTIVCMVDSQMDEVRLFNGGYQTVTTKRKINDWLYNMGIRMGVSQRDGTWYVTVPPYLWEVMYPDGLRIWHRILTGPVEFEDGMRLRPHRED